MLRFPLIYLFVLFSTVISFAQDRTELFIFDIINDENARNFFLAAEDRHEGGNFNTPEGPIRTMAEWEELDGVIITWASEFPILAQIIDAVKEEAKVYVVCANQTTVQNYLSQFNIDWSENVYFIEHPFDSIWVRDYGPNSVYKNDVDSLFLVDWIYNRPNRVRDDVVPLRIAEELDVPIYNTVSGEDRFVATGGNFMSDGMGKGFSSDLILDENPIQDINDVDRIMKDYMGIEEYLKFESLPYDLIHHIDMHMKLLDEQTLMLGEYPEGVADGPQLEANLQYLLDNFTTSYGQPFKVIRMPMPPDWGFAYPDQGGDYRTYVNSLFVNKTILIPTYEERYDTTALRIWAEAMPGYNLVPINCNSIIPRFGALHCITKEVGVQDPLRIVHGEIECSENQLSTVNLAATIQHRSGIKEAYVHVKSNLDSEFQAIALTLTDQDSDEWSTEFSTLANDIYEYEYYFSAVSNSGKEMIRPMVAPEGTYQIKNCLFTSSSEIQDINNELLEVFPNPASAITCIPVSLNESKDIQIELIDMLGRNIKTVFDGSAPRGESKYFFDASKFEAGMYLVKMSDQNSSVFQKVVLK